jgi:general secretion pathway protein G
MKVRCPYCREVFEPAGPSRCPACGKTVLLPGFFGKSPTAADVAAHRRRHSRAPGAPWAAPPAHRYSRRSFRIIVILAVLLFAGSLLMQRVRAPKTLGGRARAQLARDNLEVLVVALNRFRDECGRYPTTAEGLVSLVHNPGLDGWTRPYIHELKPDPWKRSFGYSNLSSRVLVYSRGPDGIAGNADDIRVTGGPGTSEAANGIIKANIRPPGEQ